MKVIGVRTGTVALAAIGLIAIAACQSGPSKSPPAQGVLAGTRWRLVEIQSMDDAQGVRQTGDPSRYTIDFGRGGDVAVRLDCNRGTGPFRAAGRDSGVGSLEIGPLATTKALCPPPSLGETLEQQLPFVRSYMIKDGRLHMSLMADGGILVWEAATAGR